MIDLIRREDVFKALGITDKSTKYGGDHSGYNTLMLYEIMDAVDSIPNAETTGALDDAIQEYIKDGYILAEPKEYVKDGTLTVQMPTIKEAKAVDKIVVYSDTYKQEYFMPLPKVGKWVEVTNGRGGHECSECHKYAPSYQDGSEHLSDYCPECGAKMERSE